MNTTARIETGGAPNRIHISQETAELLSAAGKAKWLTKREDAIVAKDKGELQTYWLYLGGGAASTQSSSNYSANATNERHEESENGGMDVHEKLKVLSKNDKPDKHELSTKSNRLIEWNASVLLQKTREVVIQRNEPESCITSEVVSQIAAFM